MIPKQPKFFPFSVVVGDGGLLSWARGLGGFHVQKAVKICSMIIVVFIFSSCSYYFASHHLNSLHQLTLLAVRLFKISSYSDPKFYSLISTLQFKNNKLLRLSPLAAAVVVVRWVWVVMSEIKAAENWVLSCGGWKIEGWMAEYINVNIVIIIVISGEIIRGNSRRVFYFFFFIHREEKWERDFPREIECKKREKIFHFVRPPFSCFVVSQRTKQKISTIDEGRKGVCRTSWDFALKMR